MKLKQEIISLLSHFDDDGNILPNKIVTFKMASRDSFAPSQCKRVDSLIGCMAEGNEYRIEDAPKRPREVWVSFCSDGTVMTACSKRTVASNIRFIEDTPREVTDEIAISCNEVLSKSKSFGIGPVLEMLKFYEQERMK